MRLEPTKPWRLVLGVTNPANCEDMSTNPDYTGTSLPMVNTRRETILLCRGCSQYPTCHILYPNKQREGCKNVRFGLGLCLDDGSVSVVKARPPML